MLLLPVHEVQEAILMDPIPGHDERLDPKIESHERMCRWRLCNEGAETPCSFCECDCAVLRHAARNEAAIARADRREGK